MRAKISSADKSASDGLFGVKLLTKIYRVLLAYNAPQVEAGPYRFAVAVHQSATVPVALNTHALWVALMIALTITNYGYPILTLATTEGTSVPAVYVGAQ